MSNEGPVTPAPYLDEQDIYRAVWYKDWLTHNNTKLKHNIFLRLRKDTEGLSVNPDPAYCTVGLSEPIFGIVTLKVGHVRSVDKSSALDVVPDSETHGNIKGLPFKDEDRNEALRLAKLIAAGASVYDVMGA